MPFYHFTRKTDNPKLGKDFATSTSGRDTCPDSCPLKKAGCYGDNGPTGWFWNKVTDGRLGGTWQALVDNVAALPAGHKFRHNQIGDLPTTADGVIDGAMVADLARAASHLDKPFTYTHHTDGAENRAAIEQARAEGFAVNASADSLAEADSLKADGVKLVTVTLPSDAPNVQKTPAGHTVVVCPEQQGIVNSCAECMLCGDRERKAIIGFRAHGAKAKAVSARLNVVNGG